MATTIRDVMTPDPMTVEGSATIVDAARIMRDSDIGDVIVLSDGAVKGIITDRDITIRGVAEGGDMGSQHVIDLCSTDLTTVTPDCTVNDAISLMRQKDIRRLPVVEGELPVGIVTLGDLAIESDPKSALADISAAPGNS